MRFSSWPIGAVVCGLGYAVGYVLAVRPVETALAVFAVGAGLLLGLPTATMFVHLCQVGYQRSVLGPAPPASMVVVLGAAGRYLKRTFQPPHLMPRH